MTRIDRETVKLLKDLAKAMANRMWHLQPHSEGGKLYERVEAEIAKLEAAHGVLATGGLAPQQTMLVGEQPSEQPAPRDVQPSDESSAIVRDLAALRASDVGLGAFRERIAELQARARKWTSGVTLHRAVPEEVRALVFDADLYELLTNLQNGIRTRVDKHQANSVIVRLDEARDALRAFGAAASEPFTAKAKGLVAGDGRPCPNDHDPDCRWPDCNCRQPWPRNAGVPASRGETVRGDALVRAQ